MYRMLIAGTEYYEAFDTEEIQVRPRSLEEELRACKEKLMVVKEDLKAAHEKVTGEVIIIFHFLKLSLLYRICCSLQGG